MAISALVGIGLALSAVGTVAQLAGQNAQTAALKKAEEARQQQLTLDTQRRTRDTVRQGVVQRAQAEQAAFSQGAGGGSGLPGGYGQIAGDVGRTISANNQNQDLGNQIFSANKAYYNASGTTNFGVGLSSLGGTLLNNAGLFNRVGGQA